MTILEQNISNHPLFPHIKRRVIIRGVNIDATYNQIVINACIHFFDSNQDDKDVSTAFKTNLNDWIVNNNDYTTVRDAKGNPQPNPKYRDAPAEGEDDRTDEEKEPYLKAPSFDYFLQIITNPKSPSLINILAMHIQSNDQIKFFDKLMGLPIN